jgi:murein DD-endopeptidase MepM/ murein hydrolase activator NlpD
MRGDTVVIAIAAIIPLLVAPPARSASPSQMASALRPAPLPQMAPALHPSSVPQMASAFRQTPVLQLSAARIRQGGAFGVTVLNAPAGGNLRVRFGGRVWPLYRTGATAVTYVGTDPFTRAGSHRLVVEWVSAGSARVVTRGTVTVVRETFATRRLRLDPSKEALFDPKLVAIERRKVGAAFGMISPQQLWEGPFALPTTSPRSSPYGVKSIYNGVVHGWHRGADFAAPPGSPVRAANHGVVRLAEGIPLSGNAVLVDHGLGVFTTYMHMSSIAVRVGQRVRKGDIVGRVGSTGVATGPHLHWGLRVNGLYVDPLLWVMPRRTHRGRGLGLMRGLMDEILVTPGGTGTIVSMRRTLRREVPV